jgi:hypothetical protein
VKGFGETWQVETWQVETWQVQGLLEHDPEKLPTFLTRSCSKSNALERQRVQSETLLPTSWRRNRSYSTPALLATGMRATARPPIDRRVRVGHVCIPIKRNTMRTLAQSARKMEA